MASEFACTMVGLVLGLLLTGCATDKTPFSESITQNRNASIEQSQSGAGIGVGVTKTRVYILGIDGVFQATRNHGVFPLTPGPHDIRIQPQFFRMAVKALDLIVDSGEIVMHLEAEAGHRYRVLAKEIDPSVGEVWIEDVTTGHDITSHERIALNGTAQNIPIVVSIPVRSPDALGLFRAHMMRAFSASFVTSCKGSGKLASPIFGDNRSS